MRNLVPVSVVATRIGVTPKTVRRWIEQGHLRASRTPGGHYLVAESELERFAASMEIAS